MTLPNHILGGTAITGSYMAMFNVNIFQDWKFLIIICIGSMLPDIDYPKSLIGKLFLPVSRWIFRTHGHRTLTHSLLFLFIVTALFHAIFQNLTYTALFSVSYFSHLFLDMITKAGVPLFFPFIRNSCVAPGKREMRLKTGDFRHESIVSCCFAVMIFVLQPLFTNGFWTTYNKAFSTQKHIYSEFKKNDLVYVTYSAKSQGEAIKGEGFVIDAKTDKTRILNDERYFLLDKSKHIVENITPHKTSKKMKVIQYDFYNISLDSLISICEPPYLKISLTATNKFLFNSQSKTMISEDYLNDLNIDVIEEKNTFTQNPQINLISSQIAELQKIEAIRIQKESNHKLKLTTLKNQILSETDFIKKEALMNELTELEKVKIESSYSSEIENLKSKKKLLIADDNIKRIESKPTQTKFHGFIKKVIIK